MKPLDELKASIEADSDAAVSAEAAPLQNAIDRNDRSEVLTALRTLEARLESRAAIDRHREKLREAKYAVGYAMDDVDTFAEGALDSAGSMMKPVVDAVKTNVPGAEATLASVKPSVDSMKEAFAKLPTSLRLPILGTVIAAGSYVVSYPVKWIGKLIGFVSEKGEKALEGVAEKMKQAGKIAMVGGGVLGLASFFGRKYNEGAFDPALESVGVSPRTDTPETAPVAGPTYSFEQLSAGVTIDGKNVKILAAGPTVEVQGRNWKVNMPGLVSFGSASMENGDLTVSGTVGGIIPASKRFGAETVKKIVNTLATTSEARVPVTDDRGHEIGAEFALAA